MPMLQRALCLALAGLLPPAGLAQAVSGRYSTSIEYRQMMEELHARAPSPAFIATGHRPEADPALKPEVNEDTSSLRIATAAAEFLWTKADGTLRWRNRKTQATWNLALAAGDCADGAAPAAHATSPARTGNTWTFAAPEACGKSSVTLTLLTDVLASLTLSRQRDAPDRDFVLKVDGASPCFGLGERFWQAGLTGTELDVRPQDRAGEPGHNWIFVAIPLVYTPGGLGLYADTAFDTSFRFRETGASFAMKIAHGPATLFLFSEADPKGVLGAYTGVTGRPQNPPLWTFGPWITSLQGKGPVLDVARRIRAEGMPASALWVYDELDEANNLGWPFWFGSYYGPAREFTDILHGQGFRVLSYVHPYVREQVLPYTVPSPAYEKGVHDKLLITGADGLPAGPRFETVRTGNVDFTNPAAVDWWQAMITGAVRDEGFDGWMEDFGEWVRDGDRGAGGTGVILSELYPLLYHKVTLRIAQALNPEVVPFARSGAPGSQQFSPVLWGADQSPNWSRDYGLPSVVTAGITAAMSGYSTWGPDIMSAGDSKELWMRWVEFGALTPVMRDHVWSKPEHTFNIWSDAETTAHFRRYAVLHSSLLPYLATYADEAHRTGVPIMRHTVLEFPADGRSASAEYQYLLGREMLVAPVVEPGAQLRKLYLPPGEWINFWNGDPLTGGQDVTVVAPTDQIPILVRAGSVLPFKPEGEAATWNWNDPRLLQGSLVWRAYLSATTVADGHFQLPDGTSAHFEQRGDVAALTGTSAVQRDYDIIVRTRQAPDDVRLNGRPFAHYSKGAPGHPATQWWWNPSSFEAHMIFHAGDFRLEMKGVTATQYTR